jgi:hypothetical protein
MMEGTKAVHIMAFGVQDEDLELEIRHPFYYPPDLVNSQVAR